MTEQTSIYISNHATRRYLERAKGMFVSIADDTEALKALNQLGADIKGARAEIERIAAPAMAVGAISVRSGKLRYLIKGLCVVSVVPAHGLWDGGRRMCAGTAQ